MSSDYAFVMNDFATGFNDMLQPGDYECSDETIANGMFVRVLSSMVNEKLPSTLCYFVDVYYTIALVMRECMDLSNSKKLSAVYECPVKNSAVLTRTFYNTDNCSGTVETTTLIDYECLECIDGPTISPTVSPTSSDTTDDCAAVYNANGT